MRPIAWYGERLLCEGKDGRIYLDKTSGGWLDRWLFKKFPRENASGEIVGYGPKV